MSDKLRIHIHITGAVQGVGFRPFIYNLSNSLGITGNVSNTSQGVFIEAQQTKVVLEQFLKKIQIDAPIVSRIDNISKKQISLNQNEKGFTIAKSVGKGSKTVTVLPDLATCPDCLNDILNLNDRRFAYPFTNCTNCGPRFSIINEIPYDRKNTEMHVFNMCNKCQSEYDDPLDRRFHAQPNACSKCGPKIEGSSIKEVQKDLLSGKIIALKGVGGYQLLCDATSDKVVQTLRERKHREEKPFAIMVDSIETVRKICEISEQEIETLTSYSAPIVLLKKRDKSTINLSKLIAQNNTHIGVMLPYTPLHHLLFSPMYVNKPLQILICTSGNYHDEPISITNKNANHKLNQIADAFLHHNRSISRQVDDSVVQSTKYGNQFLRIARGYAPYSIQKNHKSPAILSVGAHLKNTISISNSDKIVMSQHIGDLSNSEAYQAFLKIVEDLPKLYDIHPEIVACDLHPNYLSTKFAMSLDLPIVKVQHHHAHIGSVMAEHKITEPILGISWDGTGIGSDNTIWGGEFLICENDTFERWGHLQQFPLPGGDLASKEPRRSAIGLLSNMKLDFQFDSDWSSQEIDLIQNMVKHQINSPITSSMGRLFDGIASLIGLSQINTFEGQSAMQLQYIADQSETGFYTLNWKNNVLETDDLIMQIIQDKKNNISNQIVSAKFHNGLVKSIVEIANKSDLNHVALSGGVFQNRLLFERSVSALKSAGFNVIFNRISTPNDGGISLGQAYLASLKHQQ